MPRLIPDADLCVIGGGEAGVTAAIAGAALGLKVVVVDPARDDPGRRNWDVALATLRRAAGRAVDGFHLADPGTPLSDARAQLRTALDRAAPDRRFARLGAMNVRLVRGRARFIDPDTVAVGGTVLRARRYVLAIGARADDGPNELLARLLGPEPMPIDIVVQAGDPRNVALAQALHRLGCRSGLPGRLLPGWDPELLAPLRRQLLADGVSLGPAADDEDPRPEAVAPAVELDLAQAGIEARKDGLVLSPALRTTNRRIYAAGSCAGARSTGETQAQVAAVMKAAFFRLPVRYDPGQIPFCVATYPALASIGSSEAAARASGPVSVWRWPFAETAAGSAAADKSGFVKVIVDGRDRVVGAGLVHVDAAELIAFWSLAVQARCRLSALAEVALPSSAFADAFRRVATLAAVRRFQTPWFKRTLALLNRLP